MKTQSRDVVRQPFAFAMGMAGLAALFSLPLSASEVQVGRYSALQAVPTAAQSDLMATIITVQFPERIDSVGVAVHYLLQRSGYRLVPQQAVDTTTAGMLALPLPAVHRSLGPIPLRRALQTLAGPAFHLLQDPVHRLISFELCMPHWQLAQEAGTPELTEGAQGAD